MKRKITVLVALICLLLVGSTSIHAAKPHILLIAKFEQTQVLEEFLGDDFELSVANEADLLMNLDLFSEDAMADYDAFILGELVMSAGMNGSHIVEPWIQESIQERVAEGAGFVHIGGWCSYQGGMADWSGQWHGTPIDEILPVDISPDWDTDDEGCEIPRLLDARHPIVNGLDWRALQRVGGYNKVTASEGANVVMIDAQSKLPLIVVGTYGQGNTVAYTPGLAGGWDEDFIKWVDFPQMWLQIAQFITD